MADHVGPRDDPDRYRLDHAGSAGGEGTLWRGAVEVDGVSLPVAVKVIRETHLSDLEEWRDRWQRQAHLLHSLDHPGLVKVRELFEGPAPHARGAADAATVTLCLVMSWVDGPNFAEWLGGGRPALGQVLPAASRIAEALDYLHSGVATGGTPLVHRDVKPANILIAADGPRLVDFGLAHLTSVGGMTFAGTRSYMAPEVLAGGRFTPAADRFALGATVFSVLVGHPPDFADPERLRAELSSIPGIDGRPDLIAWFSMLLAPDPESRPALRSWVAALATMAADTRIPAPVQDWHDAQAAGVALPTTGWPATGPTAPPAAPGPPPPTTPTGPSAPTTPSGPPGATGADASTRAKRRWPWVASLAALVLVVVAAALLTRRGSASKTLSSPTTNVPVTTTTSEAPTRPSTTLATVLSAAQLQPVLAPSASYQPLLPPYYSNLNDDATNLALHGGIAALTLCDTLLATPGLGPDTVLSFVSIPAGVRNTIGFGSDAASFNGVGAKQFMAVVAREGPTCGWRLLGGAALHDQTTRLTRTAPGSTGAPISDDLIFFRAGATVVEIGSSTTRGSHTADAERLAESAAQRLSLVFRNSP